MIRKCHYDAYSTEEYIQTNKNHFVEQQFNPTTYFHFIPSSSKPLRILDHNELFTFKMPCDLTYYASSHSYLILLHQTHSNQHMERNKSARKKSSAPHQFILNSREKQLFHQSQMLLSANDNQIKRENQLHKAKLWNLQKEKSKLIEMFEKTIPGGSELRKSPMKKILFDMKQLSTFQNRDQKLRQSNYSSKTCKINSPSKDQFESSLKPTKKCQKKTDKTQKAQSQKKKLNKQSQQEENPKLYQQNQAHIQKSNPLKQENMLISQLYDQLQAKGKALKLKDEEIIAFQRLYINQQELTRENIQQIKSLKLKTQILEEEIQKKNKELGVIIDHLKQTEQEWKKTEKQKDALIKINFQLIDEEKKLRQDNQIYKQKLKGQNKNQKQMQIINSQNKELKKELQIVKNRQIQKLKIIEQYKSSQKKYKEVEREAAQLRQANKDLQQKEEILKAVENEAAQLRQANKDLQQKEEILKEVEREAAQLRQANKDLQQKEKILKEVEREAAQLRQANKDLQQKEEIFNLMKKQFQHSRYLPALSKLSLQSQLIQWKFISTFSHQKSQLLPNLSQSQQFKFPFTSSLQDQVNCSKQSLFSLQNFFQNNQLPYCNSQLVKEKIEPFLTFLKQISSKNQIVIKSQENQTSSLNKIKLDLEQKEEQIKSQKQKLEYLSKQVDSLRKENQSLKEFQENLFKLAEDLSMKKDQAILPQGHSEPQLLKNAYEQIIRQLLLQKNRMAKPLRQKSIIKRPLPQIEQQINEQKQVLLKNRKFLQMLLYILQENNYTWEQFKEDIREFNIQEFSCQKLITLFTDAPFNFEQKQLVPFLVDIYEHYKLNQYGTVSVDELIAYLSDLVQQYQQQNFAYQFNRDRKIISPLLEEAIDMISYRMKACHATLEDIKEVLQSIPKNSFAVSDLNCLFTKEPFCLTQQQSLQLIIKCYSCAQLRQTDLLSREQLLNCLKDYLSKQIIQFGSEEDTIFSRTTKIIDRSFKHILRQFEELNTLDKFVNKGQIQFVLKNYLKPEELELILSYSSIIFESLHSINYEELLNFFGKGILEDHQPKKNTVFIDDSGYPPEEDQD